jgi:hypothetical protein
MTEKPLTRADIQREREALKQRLADLDAAERILAAPYGVAPPKADAASLIGSIVAEMGSIKSAILREASASEGTTASETAAAISKWKPNYPATNVSPKFSLYGSHGLLRSENGRWFITDKGRKELDNSKN